jgi:hypothetical protein
MAADGEPVPGYERERSELRRLKNSAEKTLQRAGQMTRAPEVERNIMGTLPFERWMIDASYKVDVSGCRMARGA